MLSAASTYKIPALLILSFGLFFILSPFHPQYAHATPSLSPSPTLVMLSHATEFDFNDCTSAIVAGKNFTHGGVAVLTSLDNLLATPARVSIGSDGNFERKVNSCYTGFTGDGDGRLVGVLSFSITATDTTTGTIVTTAPVAIIDSNPSIDVLSRNVPLLHGCATVSIIGNHFIASGLVNSVVSLLAYRVDDTYAFRDAGLPHQPYQINALGGGNIAVSAQFCGLTSGEQFLLFLQDRGSYAASNLVFIQTY